MNALYIGFKGQNNSSCQLVSAMAGDKYFLTNSFGGVKRDIDRLPTIHPAVFLFGLDKVLTDSVRVELCAEASGHILHTKADVAALSRRFDSLGVSYLISGQPTHFLCNAAYYHLLQKMKSPVLLVHIPSRKNLSEKLFSRLLAAFTFEPSTM